MTVSSENVEAVTYRKVDVRLLPFLFLCYILAYLDRVNVGFAKLQMLKDLSMSDAAFATGAGIFFISFLKFRATCCSRDLARGCGSPESWSRGA